MCIVDGVRNQANVRVSSVLWMGFIVGNPVGLPTYKSRPTWLQQLQV